MSTPVALSGRVESGHSWTPQIRPFPASRDGIEFYFTASCVGKVVRTLVRQLRGPRLSTWAWWSRRSSSAVTAAVSPSSLPQVLDGAIRGEYRGGLFIAAHGQFEQILGGGVGTLRMPRSSMMSRCTRVSSVR